MPITKVPKHAKQVFKGVIFDVYQWPQKLFDGGHRTWEIIKRQDTVIVIPTIKDKIVIIRQKQPAMNEWFYSVPAGRMDKPGETPRQTAVRELLEETGLKPKRIRLWRKFQKTGKVIHTVYVFVANDCVKVADQDLDGGEDIQIRYLTFEQFLKLSDDSHLYESELQLDMLRARLHPKKKRELKKIIFG